MLAAHPPGGVVGGGGVWLQQLGGQPARVEDSAVRGDRGRRGEQSGDLGGGHRATVSGSGQPVRCCTTKLPRPQPVIVVSLHSGPLSGPECSETTIKPRAERLARRRGRCDAPAEAMGSKVRDTVLLERRA